MFCGKKNNIRRIVILVRKLDQGGAQRQLVALARGFRASGHDVSVVVFYAGGFFDSELVADGIRLLSVDKRGRWDVISFAFRLAFLLRKLRPDVTYSFMNISNILAVVLKPAISGSKIVWGIRSSDMDLKKYTWLSRWAFALEKVLSWFADLIIANSHAGKTFCVENGFPEEKIIVIHNGIDVDYFQFNRESRKEFRISIGVPETDRLVGLVGRLDPMKGHQTFLEAAKVVADGRGDVRFLCVGGGPSSYRSELQASSRSMGIGDRVLWLDGRDDMPSVYSAMDVLVSSSVFGEGFSNVLGEAMACGVPCVVTDVGDSARVVGQVGRVVPAGDVLGLASEIQRMLELGPDRRQILGNACRARVVAEFGLDKLIKRTELVLGLN